MTGTVDVHRVPNEASTDAFTHRWPLANIGMAEPTTNIRGPILVDDTISPFKRHKNNLAHESQNWSLLCKL